MSTSYAVVVEKYAERHYISRFQKKHKNAWKITWRAVVEELKRLDTLFDTTIAETIRDSEKIKICKTEFRVAQTRESRKSSGNRCIIAVEKETNIVHVLLVYSKTDLGGSQETAAWKALVRDNYPEYGGIL